MPAHSHAVSDPGRQHAVADPGHGHVVADNGHSHGVSDPGHAHSLVPFRFYGEGHGYNSFGVELTYISGGATDVNPSTRPSGTGIAIGISGSNIGIYSNATGIQVAPATSGISVGYKRRRHSDQHDAALDRS